ncbi:MAG: hypothetical protein Q9M91_03515 [Candidatus Dojkabacteria bacterium]|nr:hypothetical protein [Candidatus Dojkabacteria bacterium]MDQ7020890.1 hypothetical protein [Candidatus Dojkabacteria bacterium]
MNGKMKIDRNKIRKLYNPKVLTFLVLIPFLIIKPLALTSFLFGFPIPYFLSNNEYDHFKEVFEDIKLPEDAEEIGNNFYLIGNIIDNNKREEKRIQDAEEARKKKEEAEKAPAGEFKEAKEIDTFKVEEEIYNGCDFLAAKIIQINSEKPIEAISNELLTSFSSAVENEIDNDSYKYVYDANLKVYPLNEESIKFKVEDKEIDILKEFDISRSDLKDNKAYLIYMINDNINRYPDPRCK